MLDEGQVASFSAKPLYMLTYFKHLIMLYQYKNEL